MIKIECAKCPAKPCSKGIKDKSQWPRFCPMREAGLLLKEAIRKYKSRAIHPFYLAAARTEKEGLDWRTLRATGKSLYRWPRIREISKFAARIKAKKIGMAFCTGLSEEAAKACAILEKHGLEVYSVACSCGAIDKTEAGVPAKDKIRTAKTFEAACNPLLQAACLNKAKTAFNILFGLCLGHDMLFTRASQAPVTTLVVKDRLTGHNPVITLYSKYFRDIV